ncbi:efflux transporter outer membrane subunit [Cognatishimia sp. SS12]|uniref:efflux transporter outer membrane subunit n=1 Tax=Cognatishimia sp. SS12 TaxID=2979465 RepID=UPI00232B0F59|nr:efflux transporter outer membrane subunit [Cognatishimia sp. SS12]MDC0739502.1 efflux transporter outer membrane subunit [Cognatishimia sp. SS12]
MGTIAVQGFIKPLIAAALVSGCAVGTEYQKPTTPVPAKFAAPAANAGKVSTTSAWWQGFKDPVLNQLVAIALRDNLQLAQARLRVDEADALVLTAGPVIDVNGRIESQVASSNIGNDRSLGAISGSAVLFGSQRFREEAARARASASLAELDAARLLVLSNLASAYVDLRFVQKRLSLKYKELETWQRTSRDLDLLQQQGATTRLDVLQPTAEIAETRAEISVLGIEVERQKNRIATLLGKIAGTNPVDLRYRGQPYPRFNVASGVPADLLANRPDIRTAEHRYRLAVAEMNVAEANLYPQLTLNGTISARSDASPVRGAIGLLGLSIPIFNQGAGKAQVKARHANAQAAFLQWKSQVLVAIEEVETLLVAQRKLGQAVGNSSQSVKLNTEAINLSRQLFNAQEMSVLDFVRLQRNQIQAEANLAQNRRQRALNYIALQIALGAGSSQPVAPAPSN